MKRDLQYNVIFNREEDGSYLATVPSLPGCVTSGETLEEAQTLIEDAIRGYLQVLEKHGDQIPSDNISYVKSVFVSNFMPSKNLEYA